jgi:hypothetical protein
MLEELERRNHAPANHSLLHSRVEQFSQHFHRVPNQLGLEHIRQYQSALLRWRVAAWPSPA